MATAVAQSSFVHAAACRLCSLTVHRNHCVLCAAFAVPLRRADEFELRYTSLSGISRLKVTNEGGTPKQFSAVRVVL